VADTSIATFTEAARVLKRARQHREILDSNWQLCALMKRVVTMGLWDTDGNGSTRSWFWIQSMASTVHLKVKTIAFMVQSTMGTIGWSKYPLRPKIMDVFYFQTSYLIIRLIQIFYVNYKIN
jgi:hypothetical protein